MVEVEKVKKFVLFSINNSWPFEECCFSSLTAVRCHDICFFFFLKGLGVF